MNTEYLGKITKFPTTLESTKLFLYSFKATSSEFTSYSQLCSGLFLQVLGEPCMLSGMKSELYL